MTDASHLIALITRLGNERSYLAAAKTQAERDLRKVWISQIEREIAHEEKFIGVASAETEMNDDDILAELMA
jgi:hypothetical protein